MRQVNSGGDTMNLINRNAFVGGAFLLLALVLAGPASAHHSVQAQFDIHKTFTVSGTVAKVEWINPHSYLTINVTGADGKVQNSAVRARFAEQG
jgi:arginine exporter protein ArgO